MIKSVSMGSGERANCRRRSCKLDIVAGLGVVGKIAATDIRILTDPEPVGDVADRPLGKPACVPVADALLSSGSIRTAVSCTGVLAVVTCLCAEESSSDSVRFAAGVDCVPVAAVVVVWEVNWRGPTVGVVIERGRNAAVLEVVEPDSDAVVFLDFFNDGFIDVAAGDGLLDLFSRFLASARSC